MYNLTRPAGVRCRRLLVTKRGESWLWNVHLMIVNYAKQKSPSILSARHLKFNRGITSTLRISGAEILFTVNGET